MKYLAVLGRQPEISIAELEMLSDAKWHQMSFSGRSSRLSSQGSSLGPRSNCGFPSKDISMPLDIDRLGGTMKLAVELDEPPLEFLAKLPEGKLTIGVSDYSKKASRKTASMEALKLKKILVRHGRSVRVVENKDAVLSTATSLHNGLNGKNERKVELIKVDDEWYKVIGVQDIDAYAKRDQARPARDAKVGMLPPKLAQILINLCGPLKSGLVVLDPFCGTGVVLQEALLMGYSAYGTDISERMVEYSRKNMDFFGFKDYFLEVGNAIDFKWKKEVNAVACEGYLGKPFSKIPTEMELKEQKQECGAIILGFLKNLAGQIKKNTPVVIAVPAWLRPDKSYERLEIVDEIEKLGYNVNNKTREGLLYHRDSQIVARDILILRKK
ncbi:methyltransferase domain-containing protein [Candidatus Saccharibacteria bacterium]|nr:methyltransferase domain-containing protein [Candidatus Saccharibacteria bacterium]